VYEFIMQQMHVVNMGARLKEFLETFFHSAAALLPLNKKSIIKMISKLNMRK